MHSKNISGQQDLSNFARNTPVSANLLRIPKKIFAPPQPPGGEGEEALEYNVSFCGIFLDWCRMCTCDVIHINLEAILTFNFTFFQDNLPPIFKNELIIEREASLQLRPSLEALRREAQDLEAQIRQLQVFTLSSALITNDSNGCWSFISKIRNNLKRNKILSFARAPFTCLTVNRNYLQLSFNSNLLFVLLRRHYQDSIDALARNQQRGLDSSLYNKANELQEDISMKKFDLRAKQIHLSAVRAQVRTFFVRVKCQRDNFGWS